MAEANLVLAEALVQEGDGPRAAEHADAARLAFHDMHDVANGIRADIAIAQSRALDGQVAEARARLENAIGLARRLGDPDVIAVGEAALTGVTG